MLPSTLLINKHMKLFFITGNKTLPICNQVMICNNARCSQVIGSTQNMFTHYQIFRNSFFWPFQQALKLPEKEDIYHFPPHISESFRCNLNENYYQELEQLDSERVQFYRLSYDCHFAIDHDVSIAHCRSSSGDSVDLLSRNFCTTVAVSDLCITKQQFA